MGIFKNKKKALKHLIKNKKHNSELSFLLGLIFFAFILPSSVALFADNQSIKVSNTDAFSEFLQESQRASFSQQWSQGTTVSGCINPWDFWEFLWRLFYRFKPNMDFTANVTNINPGETVQFEYTGGQIWWPKTYHWDFGDGGISEERDPIYTYNSPGIYDVSLTIIYFWIFDDTILKEDYIEVSESNQVPDVDFEVNNITPLTGDLLQFTYTGTEGDGLTAYLWDFGDDHTSDVRDPERIYNTAGIYTVSLTVWDSDNDSDTEIKPNYVSVGEDFIPIANFTVNNSQPIAGEGIEFSYTGTEGNGLITYLWDFGNEETSDMRNPEYVYDFAGIYNITLTVWDNDGDNDTEVKNEYIYVEEDFHPIADFIVNENSPIAGQTIEFLYIGTEGNGLITYLWDFGNEETSDMRDPECIYEVAGNYNISLQVWDLDGDFDSIFKNEYIIVQEDLQPIADFDANDTELIAGQMIEFNYNGTEGNGLSNYLWNFGNGETSNLSNPTYIYDVAGNYDITLTVWDIDGDTDTKIKNEFITVGEDFQPNANFTVNSTIINPDQAVNFTFKGTEGNKPTEFLWDFGDGTFSIEKDPIHVYEESGNYSVYLTLTDIDGDQDTNDIPIIIYAGIDSDTDGLTDWDEINVYYTDPNNFDTDFDNIHDGDEVFIYFTDPLNPDTDADDLMDDEELFLYGTSPLNPDTDSDELMDGEEINDWNTDPLNSDTDEDGLTDGEEVLEYGTEPNIADTDEDGLTDGDEVFLYGTDPLIQDTDGDGLSDGEEINDWNTDPLNFDSDGDDLSDGDEILLYSTDPLNPDTDADDLNDGEEINIYLTDPLLWDTDNDGYSDGDEIYIYGSDPLDPNDPDNQETNPQSSDEQNGVNIGTTIIIAGGAIVGLVGVAGIIKKRS